MPKTIAEKLQIKPGGDLLVVGAESEQRALLDPLPEDTSVVETATGDVAVLFATDRTALDERLAYAIPALNDTRAVWIAYPKGNRTNINRDSIWKRAEELGWTLNANISLGDTWSAVRIKPVG